MIECLAKLCDQETGRRCQAQSQSQHDLEDFKMTPKMSPEDLQFCK